jgi:hypothetical protein
MADFRHAVVYRLTPQDVIGAVIDFAAKHGMVVPNRVDGGTLSLEDGTLMVTIIDGDPKVFVPLPMPSSSEMT